MWLREFMLPFQNPSKRLNKGWEMICSLEKCCISKRMLNSLFKPRSVSAVSFVIFCRLLSHSYSGLFENPSATLVYPPRNATQLITLSHNPRMSARRPGAIEAHTDTVKTAIQRMLSAILFAKSEFNYGRSKDFKVQECISHCSL